MVEDEDERLAVPLGLQSTGGAPTSLVFEDVASDVVPAPRPGMDGHTRAQPFGNSPIAFSRPLAGIAAELPDLSTGEHEAAALTGEHGQHRRQGLRQSRVGGSNSRHFAYKANALPTELTRHADGEPTARPHATGRAAVSDQPLMPPSCAITAPVIIRADGGMSG